jgi:predicted metal-binding protein
MEKLEEILDAHPGLDYRWIDPREIVVAQWVRMKCTYGCASYGRNATCPPNAPAVEECRSFFGEYRRAAILHFRKAVDHPEDRHAWTAGVNRGLLGLERAVFLAGYPRAFLLFIDCCSLCAQCAGTLSECKNPGSPRPTPEAMAVDLFSTVAKVGLPLEVLRDYDQPMNRYGFLLIE